MAVSKNLVDHIIDEHTIIVVVGQVHCFVILRMFVLLGTIDARHVDSFQFDIELCVPVLGGTFGKSLE